MRSGMKKSITVTVAAVLFLSGCARFVKSLAAATALQNGLHRKYNDEVKVTVNSGGYLAVVFINSPLNYSDATKRFERAQDAARFVSLNFADIRSINQIWVGFIIAERRFVFYQTSRLLDSFGFDRNGALLGGGSNRFRTSETFTSSEDPRATVIRFSAPSNQSDISITRIQLEGNMQNGIALVPHFVVTGDARPPAKGTRPPQVVELDIASYSDKPLFADKTRIEISCDGEVVASGPLLLRPTQESGTDMAIAQFLSARISFRVLREMANAQRVSIVLGSKRFELLPDDIKALSQMASYVADE